MERKSAIVSNKTVSKLTEFIDEKGIIGYSRKIDTYSQYY